MATSIVRAACPHDCPDTRALLVTVKDGIAIELRGDPDHPATAGVLCAKVSRYAERTYHKDRLLYPMRRVGKNGWGTLERKGWQKLNVPDAPFANGRFAKPSGKCKFYSERMLAEGLDPLPTYIPPYKSVKSNPELAESYPLAMISPPARNFLNSIFVNVLSLRNSEGEPLLDMHPEDAKVRGIESGDRVKIYNARGSFVAKARITKRARARIGCRLIHLVEEAGFRWQECE